MVLFPLSQKSIESQAQMSILTPELKKIKEPEAKLGDFLIYSLNNGSWRFETCILNQIIYIGKGSWNIPGL